ncbi:hypothetical protein [Quadrisphaera sp. DSM 44207]|uniref:hypothetical protein n=1 Tax=Quadrisphaera sp. DSM 44207 TaxID=1881057 RepID=UPI000889BCD4|nr:hypothetical protein [Quadrisphaera sp. DSM 44207]SDQ64150.1 hypothetical protein SAMN05428996_2202 [Quadrisphaera sp. DSM 44207]
MWVLLTARFRAWVLFSVVLPLARRLARGLATRIERSGGSSRTSRALRRVGGTAPARRRRRFL